MFELKSFVADRWIAGPHHNTLVNPATEEPVATAMGGGIDFREALTHARDVGGPALRAMTFRARGEILRAMSRAIHAHRDELLGLAILNGGNTRSDAKFDVDGASGTLAAYADLAAELGDAKVLVDGDGVQLGRSARLYGEHVYMPRHGVAVHINAFNFPAWGLCEKAATALLAGMPVITKPATSTALVAHRIMQIFVDEKVLPPGALSFVCGSTGNLLELLTGQDVLAFTGSGHTATALRKGNGVVSHATHINVEADSLNAAVLGPDVEDASDVFHLFVADVCRDMTQKTGQKCTAIRRVYVPLAKVDVVLERLRERLSSVKVGDPALDDVTMGPVATGDQLNDVRKGIRELAACGKIVFGHPDEVTAIGRQGNKGYFVSPVLVHSGKPDANDAVHNREVFGPVATVMPYESAEGAASLVASGGGGLVSSVYSDDRDFIRETVTRIAPFHGRVTIGSSKTAAQSVPPGTVLPQLLHGGPGRAGGGEELGGRRGLAFYMQRSALQGDRALLEHLTGKR